MSAPEAANPTLDAVRAHLATNGAIRLYAKFLAPNDNSKNQVYLGGDFSALNILPVGKPTPAGDDEKSRNRLYATLAFSWLLPDGNLSPAPNTQLILYPDYPEVRLSGFLRSSPTPPTELMTTREEGRVLLLGVTNSGMVIAYAAAGDSMVAREIRVLESSSPRVGVFVQLPLPMVSDPVADREKLLSELCRIAGLGWIRSKRLDRDGDVVSCPSMNCGGFTLEAELGIRPNSKSLPDYAGWEVKQHAVSNFAKERAARVTLMTPEPSQGVYADEGVLAFLDRYGYPDRRGRADRVNFGGLHRAGTKCRATGLTLTMLGYDADKNRITEPGAGIALIDAGGRSAAEWRYADLMAHWNRKHSTAVYIPSVTRRLPEREYMFGSKVRLGTGTDFFLFLKSLAAGHVYYDPGIKVENRSTKPLVKRRSQFRIESRNLSDLYHRLEVIDVCAPAPPGA